MDVIFEAAEYEIEHDLPAGQITDLLTPHLNDWQMSQILNAAIYEIEHDLSVGRITDLLTRKLDWEQMREIIKAEKYKIEHDLSAGEKQSCPCLSDALADAAAYYLQLPQLDVSRVLERGILDYLRSSEMN